MLYFSLIFFFLLPVILLFLFFKNKPILNPSVSVEYSNISKNVLGTTSKFLPNPTKYYNNQLASPSVTKTETKEQKKKDNKHSESKSSNDDEEPSVISTPSDIEVLNNKINVISFYSKNYSTNEVIDEAVLKSIFEKQIIDTFGILEVNNVFTDLKNISFSNIKIAGNEATAVAVVEYSTIIKTFVCSFVKQQGDWYLYKTDSL